MGEEGFDDELRDEWLKEIRSVRKIHERSEALRLGEGIAILLIRIAGFLYALIYFPHAPVSSALGYALSAVIARAYRSR